jgi:hypothetical protein
VETQCSEECKVAFQQWQLEVDWFKKKYPMYCTGCNGTGGGSSWYDRDTGYTEVEPCMVCNDEEEKVPICSLCGQIKAWSAVAHVNDVHIMTSNGIETVPYCYTVEQWTQQCTCPNISMPNQPECLCYLEDYRNDTVDAFRYMIESHKMKYE